MTIATPTPDAGSFTLFRDDDLLMNFIGDIGVRRGDGRLTLKVVVRQGAVNPLGMVHGGATSTLFDVAMYELAKTSGEAVTVAQEVKFLKPILANDPLFIEAELLRAGRRSSFCTARAIQQDKLCAFATAQFAHLKEANVTPAEGA